MTKLMTALLFAILLAGCGAEDNGQEKKFETPNKTEKTTTIETNTSTEATSSETAKVEPVKKEPVSYAKNIFELTTVEGKKLHVDEAENGIIFQEHKDKTVFLLFFGYRCPPCLTEIPALIKIAEEKGDKLEIIAMEVQRLPEAQLKIFKESKKLNYTVLSGEHTANSEFISYIAERAQWTGAIPFLVGINPKGEVGFVHIGGMGDAQLNSVFDQLSK